MKKNTKTIISCTLVFLLVSLGVGALGVASKGFTDWDTNNWGDNFKNTINKDNSDIEDPTVNKVQSIDVDQTVSTSNYLMPSGSVNFGNSRAMDDTEVDTLTKLNSLSTKTINSLGVNGTYSTLTLPQTINLTATVTPNESIETLDLIQWEISWNSSEEIGNYIILENVNELTCTVKVLQAFNSTATLKVTVGKNGLNVSDTCNVEFYKQLEGIDLVLTGAIADNVLNEGDLITYKVNESYSHGTIDQVESSETVISYDSLLSDYVINYDFKKNETVNFSYGEFYNGTSNFTGIDVLTGSGRNAVNSKLKVSSGDFKITATKGIYSKSVILDIEPESVVYPESVTIGDGGDIEIGKN